MAVTPLRVIEGHAMDKSKALDAALSVLAALDVCGFEVRPKAGGSQ